MRVHYRFFWSAPKAFERIFLSWDTTFQEAADFASTLPPDRLINISHSAGKGVCHVTVWYWADDEPAAS